ncbi:substrate-binding periplasmic protein [Ruminiclostridium cellobioparum]|uniref:substrate-binding periplasmic protein n=1 Tax=Ruminiclostridium cellobioparum TaxID=29355 RepID=UPI0028B1262B|nr:ABC transporter substrate-binding protein [Ruminiclostridium cellobioparum]
MNKIKRVLICLSALLIIALTVTACGSSASKNENVLKVGIDDTYPPMEYKDDSGANTGFDIEVAQALGEKLGMKVEFVPTAWTAIFSALEAEKYDVIISSLSITEERQKTLTYTRPYIANNQVIIVKKDLEGINSEKDLKDKIVCVQMGTTSDESCKEFNKVTPFKEYKQYEKMTEALSELKIGRVDALVADLVVAKYFVAKDPDSYKIVNTTLPNEPIGAAVKKFNTALAEKLDKAMEEIMNDGTLKKISEKWFGEDMTSNIE